MILVVAVVGASVIACLAIVLDIRANLKSLPNRILEALIEHEEPDDTTSITECSCEDKFPPWTEDEESKK